jgi:hypothetical protein
MTSSRHRSPAWGGAQVIALPSRAGSDPWLSKRQLAAHYGRSTRWVELRVNEGLPSRMIGGHRGFQLSVADRWLTERFG